MRLEGIKSNHGNGASSAAAGFNRLESIVLNDHLNVDNFLKLAVKNNTQSPAHFEGEMVNVEDVNKQMAKTSFILECEKNMTVTLPLLLKIKDKKMILERYQLNNGLCQAVNIAFAHFPEIANDFYLDNNNLSDDDFSILLEGMTRLENVKRISYSHNDFGMKSLQSLMTVILK